MARRTNERAAAAGEKRVAAAEPGAAPRAAPATRTHFARAASGAGRASASDDKQREEGSLAWPASPPARRRRCFQQPATTEGLPTWPPNVPAAGEGDRREATRAEASCMRRRDVGSNWTSAAAPCGAVASPTYVRRRRLREPFLCLPPSCFVSFPFIPPLWSPFHPWPLALVYDGPCTRSDRVVVRRGV